MRGMVVAPQALAVDAGINVLRRGGNAVDAAVTTAFVQMVVDPQMCGLAGFGVANVRGADGTERILDFNSPAGSKATEEMWQDQVIEQDWTGYGYHLRGQVNDIGYASIMTPGTVAGLAELLGTCGTIDWRDALQPAIQAARDGFLVSPDLWRLWNTPVPAGRISMLDRLRATEPSRQIYLSGDGQTPIPGQLFQNPDYARALQRLADAGPGDFYTGELAQRMVDDFEQHGAFVTAEDLANYRVRVTEPLSIEYRGHRVTTNQPAGGGLCLAEILKIVEHDDIASLSLNSVEYLDYVGHAMKAAYADWYRFAADPEFVDVPVQRLLSEENTGEWHRRIKEQEHFTVPTYPQHTGTTHVSVVDERGNCVALTHSLGSSSGVVTSGLGYMYNNNMNAANPEPGLPNSIAPGKCRITGMCPTIVFHQDEPTVVLGAPGGTRIITGVFQSLVNVLDHGLTPFEAVAAPRFDCQGEYLDCEARIPSWVREELRHRGFNVVQNPASYGSFARVQLIQRDPITGVLRGGADPRGGGAVMSVTL